MKRLSTFTALAILAACAHKQSWDEVSREVYVHTLPRGAALALDGAVQGTAPVSVVVPHGEAVAGGGEVPARLVASLAGYSPTEVLLDRNHLPTERVVVLAPVLDGKPIPAPGWGDARAMADVGGQLAGHQRCAEALEFLERSLELDGHLAVAHRDAGRCYRVTGQKPQARQHLGSYLMMLPEASDARQVRLELDAIDGSRTIDLGSRH